MQAKMVGSLGWFDIFMWRPNVLCHLHSTSEAPTFFHSEPKEFVHKKGAGEDGGTVSSRT